MPDHDLRGRSVFLYLSDHGVQLEIARELRECGATGLPFPTFDKLVGATRAVRPDLVVVDAAAALQNAPGIGELDTLSTRCVIVAPAARTTELERFRARPYVSVFASEDLRELCGFVSDVLSTKPL